jgi:uncharacterized membrane protein YfcA
MLAGYGNPLLPDYSIGFVNLIGLAIIAPATILAAPVGAHLAHLMNRRHLTLFFGIFLLVVSIRMLRQTLVG